MTRLCSRGRPSAGQRVASSLQGASASSTGWQLGVLTTSPDLSVEWLCRGSNRRRSRVDVGGKLTQGVTDSADVLGSRSEWRRPPEAVFRAPAMGLRIHVVLVAAY